MMFWIGIALGVLLTLPLVWIMMRRTERRVRHLVQRARAAEHLAELGTLTGGLAHEIKNPLSTVNLNIQLIQEDLRDVPKLLPEDHQALERIGRIQRRIDSLVRETARLKDILEDFLRFAGRLKLDLEPADINQLLDELADFFHPQAQAAQIQIRTQLSANPSVTLIDKGLLKQALLNLLINATQAMTQARQDNQPHGGCNELILQTQNQQVHGQEEIRIHVIDTGPGINPQVADKVFQPYFSTKRTGTGLGLPTTRRIIQEHGGTISLHSVPGRGSDFSILLPRRTTPPSAAST